MLSLILQELIYIRAKVGSAVIFYNVTLDHIHLSHSASHNILFMMINARPFPLPGFCHEFAAI